MKNSVPPRRHRSSDGGHLRRAFWRARRLGAYVLQAPRQDLPIIYTDARGALLAAYSTTRGSAERRQGIEEARGLSAAYPKIMPVICRFRPTAK